MYSQRISACQRGMLEVELRRAGGNRVGAGLALLCVLGMLALSGGGPSSERSSAVGLHTESYEFEAPAALGDEFRRDALAMTPAAGKYEEPDMVVNYEVTA